MNSKTFWLLISFLSFILGILSFLLLQYTSPSSLLKTSQEPDDKQITQEEDFTNRLMSNKIIFSEIIPTDCKIKIKTTKNEILIKTNFLIADANTKCNISLLNKVSPSGKYVIFQDISGGVDSILRVYSLDHNETFTLDFFGTSSIFDLEFMPDDTFIVLYGYKGYPEEQYLKIISLTALFSDYPANIDKKFRQFTNLSKYSKRVKLPNVGKDYTDLEIFNNRIRLYSNNKELLKEYKLEDLYQ